MCDPAVLARVLLMRLLVFDASMQFASTEVLL